MIREFTEAGVRAALGLGEGAEVRLEPLGKHRFAPVEVEVREGVSVGRYILRRYAESEASATNAAVLEALQKFGWPFVPRIAGSIAGVPVEVATDGVPGIGLSLPAERWQAAVEALAALHDSGLQEGLRWGSTKDDVLPPAPPPLFRLGFAAHERAPAEPAFVAAREVLKQTPFGFVHGAPTVERVLFGAQGVVVVDFGGAGFGPQLFDVAALLATSGLAANDRARLAGLYGQRRKLEGINDLVDLAVLVWGIEQLLGLPRRQVEYFGDDVATERLVTEGQRIERALREPAGSHPLARAIREALWPT